MPAPFVFVVVIVVTVALIIFFGAWAAASNAEGREFTFAVAGANLEGSKTAGAEDKGPSQDAFGVSRIGETSDESGAVTWWGRGFLKACPLH